MSLSEMVAASNGRKKILIVDDDATFGSTLRRLVAMWLPELDIELLVSDPRDGAAPQPWEYVCDQHPLIAGIICDTAMPGMNGIQLCRLVRGHYPSIPFVLMSGNFKPFANDLRAIPPNLQPSCLVGKDEIVTRAKIDSLAMHVFGREAAPM